MRVKGLLSPFSGKSGDPGMRPRDPGPRACKSGVEFYGVLISSQSLARTFFGVPIFKKTALQVRLMGLDVFRPALFRRLHLRLNFLFVSRIRRATRQPIAHLRHDCRRQFSLDCEHVF